MSERDLTVEERMRAAVAHYCDGVDQHVIASVLGVNQGRVNEACRAIKAAATKPTAALKLLRNRTPQPPQDDGTT